MTASYVMSQSLADIFRRSGVRDDVVDWSRIKGLVDPMSFALAVSEERLVDAELLPLLLADTSKVESILDEVALRKAWTLCRTRMKDEESRPNFDTQEDKALPALTGQSLDAKWKELHGFILSGDRKLAETVQNRVFMQLTSEPPRLEQFPPETLRLLGATDSKTHQDLIVEAGKIRTGSTQAESISAHHILYIRLLLSGSLWHGSAATTL